MTDQTVHIDRSHNFLTVSAHEPDYFIAEEPGTR